jgi:spore maturation protein CgeB
MRIAMFYHSLLSDWHHVNAHFLRGVAAELVWRAHEVCVLEPRDAWSLKSLIADQGKEPIREFHTIYPGIQSLRYDLQKLDLDRVLKDVELVIVHEWNDPELIRRLGEHRHQTGAYRLLFHDTHHRPLTARGGTAAGDLSHYDGVLAIGQVIRDRYLAEGWAERAWTWHEAADTRIFQPVRAGRPSGDVVWIGSGVAGERTAELREFLLEPVAQLELKARAFGVGYAAEALEALAACGIDYGGWLANYRVPHVLAQFKATVHIPHRPYAQALPGIPTIRPFEALACGIPLVSAPWADTEGLFSAGRDYLVARNGEEVKRLLHDLLHDRVMAGEIAAHGRRTILERHTCAHRVDQLLEICRKLGMAIQPAPQPHSNRLDVKQWQKV